MSIPKPSRPEYSTTIPSTGKKIKYQPFTVKEEKVLILASESEDLDEISNAISNVLSNCVTTPGFDPQDLALFDIEFLFLRTRAKSIGEKISVKITDPNDPSYQAEKEINVDSIKVETVEGHTPLIDISDDIKVKMGYPNLAFFAEGVKIDSLAESTETVARCISSIVIGEEVYNRSDMSVEEIAEWLDALTAEQFKKIMHFFETMPKLRHVVKCKNPNTGKEFRAVLEGLADFF